MASEQSVRFKASFLAEVESVRAAQRGFVHPEEEVERYTCEMRSLLCAHEHRQSVLPRQHASEAQQDEPLMASALSSITNDLDRFHVSNCRFYGC